MATEAQIQWARFPLIASHSHARVWLQIQANLGLARNTIEAYGRALEDYLKFSSNSSINIEAATQEHISQYVHHLTNKPQLSEPNVRRIDSAAGRFINLLGQCGEEVSKPATGEFSPDPKDDPFYHCALGGDADYIITDNVRDFPPFRNRKRPRIVTPAGAVAILWP
jgi:Phage integrase, N-terminal SAM-like domain